ncbi:MAG: CRISPR-associated helicase Cas3' [Anaerococcus vaginalis]|uniref:CRISPR-associated helicase Cas3' n=1 Tax=Anaerococcus vaginalis TaxID=33037 RepID=UPI001E158833|nr:CRISPR-associated helicase Cas3' [Anaerococcus vaginalis]MBS4889308.1 CRISPR-associated helicase Cas3' [Anaerococcus vaginalis]
MFDNIYAHIDQKNNEKKQKLFDHLINTAFDSKNMGKEVGIGNISFLVGLFHDIGKVRDEFQEKIKGKTNRHVDHSSLGGIFIHELVKKLKEKDDFSEIVNDENIKYEFNDFCNILIYSILSHHSQYNMVRKNKENNYVFTSIDRMANLKEEFGDTWHNLYEKISKYLLEKNIDIYKIFKNAFFEYDHIIKKLNECSCGIGDDLHLYKAIQFYNSMIIRLVLSILKSADVKDTINSYEKIIEDDNEKEDKKIINSFADRIEKKYKSFSKANSAINIARNDIAKQILIRSIEDNNGIYKLDLPTGSGKTLLSLRYGVNQLKFKNKKRFFYITSYLSVLEQNAKVMKEILENDSYILEHHSNVINDKDEEKYTLTNDETCDSFNQIKRQYLIDDWTNLIILTTMVQFFNTLFKGRSSNIRRFKSMINSVIILDELQSLPVDVLYPTNLALNFLKVVMKVNIILSTATQPTFDYNFLVYKLNYGDFEEKNIDVISLNKEQEEVFKRTKVKIYNQGKESTLEDLKKLIIDNSSKSVLTILNTKKAVKDTYELLKKFVDDNKLYYLTTNLHSVDRLKIIEEIKVKLKNKENIIVISTQLIEAGVDVDFEIVIRSYTGIDSIIQSMGRCNREGKIKSGIVYLINLSRQVENLDHIISLKERKVAGKYALDRLDKNQEINEIVDLYFNKLYENLTYNRLSFEIKNSNLVELLSTNEDMITNIRNIEENHLKYFNNINVDMFQSFKEVYDNFNLINENQNTAIVECEDTKYFINKLRNLEKEFYQSYDINILKNMKIIMRKLNPYSVNISNSNLNLCEKIMDGKVYILEEEFYNKKTGVEFENSDLFII